MKTNYKILIIGFGSIGKRHARILSENFNCEIYVFRDQSKKQEKVKGVKQYYSKWENIPFHDLDFGLICNPSVFHVDTAIKLVKKNLPVFIEKPISVSARGLTELKRLISKKKVPVLVGFNLRYHVLYEKIKELSKKKQFGRLISLNVETGQYLPDWRKKDHKKSYSAFPELGGGVIFDLTHEIDIAIDLLGEASLLSCVKAVVPALKIKSEALAEISIIHKNKAISHIHLDYLQKKYTRRFKCIFENGEILWDYAKGLIKVNTARGEKLVHQPDSYNRDDTFIKQFKHWFKVLDGKEKPRVNYIQAIKVSRAAITAHKSSKEMKWLKLSKDD